MMKTFEIDPRANGGEGFTVKANSYSDAANAAATHMFGRHYHARRTTGEPSKSGCFLAYSWAQNHTVDSSHGSIFHVWMVEESDQPFRFSDWDPTTQTCPAYLVDDGDVITHDRVAIIDGKPCNGAGRELRDDGVTRTLVGWSHSICQSFEDGRILVPLKGSRA